MTTSLQTVQKVAREKKFENWSIFGENMEMTKRDAFWDTV